MQIFSRLSLECSKMTEERTCYEMIESEKKREIMEEFHEMMGFTAEMHENGEHYKAYVYLYEACKEMSKELRQNSELHFE